MAKITLTDVASGYLSTTTFNANNTLLEAAIENTLSRDGTAPNTMSADLDMNSNQISNLPTPTNNSHAANKAYVDAVAIAASAGDMQAANNLSDVASAATSLVNLGLTATAAEINLLDLSGLTAGDVLSADTASTASWKAAAASGISNVVEDVTPQLGGNLDLNSKTVNGTGTIGITGAITATSYGGITEANLLDKAATEVVSGAYSFTGGVTFTTGNIVAGTIDADFDAITGTSYGGITEANLLDKTASENISGATWNFQDNNVTRPVLTDYSVEDSSATVSANAVTLTYSTSQSYSLDLEAATGDVTVTISGGPPSGRYGEMIVQVKQDTTADRTLTWAGGTFVWPGGTEVEPKTGSDAITIYYLSTWDAGTTWYINGVEYGA
jgi:hypothetical protein